jgi:hypothetical protein
MGVSLRLMMRFSLEGLADRTLVCYRCARVAILSSCRRLPVNFGLIAARILARGDLCYNRPIF